MLGREDSVRIAAAVAFTFMFFPLKTAEDMLNLLKTKICKTKTFSSPCGSHSCSLVDSDQFGKLLLLWIFFSLLRLAEIKAAHKCSSISHAHFPLVFQAPRPSKKDCGHLTFSHCSLFSEFTLHIFWTSSALYSCIILREKIFNEKNILVKSSQIIHLELLSEYTTVERISCFVILPRIFKASLFPLIADAQWKKSIGKIYIFCKAYILTIENCAGITLQHKNTNKLRIGIPDFERIWRNSLLLRRDRGELFLLFTFMTTLL